MDARDTSHTGMRVPVLHRNIFGSSKNLGNQTEHAKHCTGLIANTPQRPHYFQS